MNPFPNKQWHMVVNHQITKNKIQNERVEVQDSPSDFLFSNRNDTNRIEEQLEYLDRELMERFIRKANTTGRVNQLQGGRPG